MILKIEIDLSDSMFYVIEDPNNFNCLRVENFLTKLALGIGNGMLERHEGILLNDDDVKIGFCKLEEKDDE